jgi:hypothetical protein
MPDEHPRELWKDEGSAAPGADHYREIASRLRDLARQCRFPRARLELVQLAITFERRADRLDNGGVQRSLSRSPGIKGGAH